MNVGTAVRIRAAIKHLRLMARTTTAQVWAILTEPVEHGDVMQFKTVTEVQFYLKREMRA